MGLRSRTRSSANNPYVRHHKVSPSPNPHLKASNSIYIERLPFVWKTRKFRGEFKWNGSSRRKIFRKRGIPFEVLPFSNSYREFSDRRRPFVWITSARPHVERKWKIYWYFVNGTTLNPVPVLGAKKRYQYHLTENFHRNFRTSDKRSLSHMENINNYRV